MKIKAGKSNIHGRGIFAEDNIKKDEVIEVCPVISLDKEDTKEIDKTLLFDYYFAWREGGSAIALGKASLYNHSYTPNAVYKKDFQNDTLTFVALRDVKEGEEILSNYNRDPNCREEVWFDK